MYIDLNMTLQLHKKLFQNCFLDITFSINFGGKPNSRYMWLNVGCVYTLQIYHIDIQSIHSIIAYIHLVKLEFLKYLH